MNDSDRHDAVTARFMRPVYAVDTPADWPISGAADTPGEDACCRIFLAVAANDRLSAAFGAFGPPAVVAASDWVCAQVDGETTASVCCPSVRDVETALALTSTQRYAGALAIDALTNAMIKLRR